MDTGELLLLNSPDLKDEGGNLNVPSTSGLDHFTKGNPVKIASGVWGGVFGTSATLQHSVQTHV